MQEDSEEVVLRLPEDVHKLCRTCLTVTEEGMQMWHNILIIDENNLLTEVAEMLHSFSSLKIIPDDGLPMSICEDCASKLEIAYNFKHQCEKTDASLRKIMEMPPQELKPGVKRELVWIKQENYNFPSTPSPKGVVLYENKQQQKIVTNSDDNLDININISNLFENHKDLIYNAMDARVENESRNLDYKLTEDNQVELIDIYALIQERKQYAKDGVRNHERMVTNSLVSIKEEVDSEEEILTEYICNQCNSSYTNDNHFKMHIMQCRRNLKSDGKDAADDSGENFPPFECQMCGKIFKTRHAHKIHVANHNLQTIQNKFDGYHCDLCDKVFRSEAKLATHFFRHAKQAEEEFKNDGDEDMEDVFGLMCHLCSERFESEEEIHSHIKKQHKKIGLIACEICQKEFNGEVRLISHLRKHGIQISVCKICLKRFDSYIQYKEHVNTHQVEKTRNIFRCPICKLEFKNSTSLRAHSVEHLNDAYKCNKCKRSYNNVVAFETHMKQHTEPRYLCSLCGKQYFSSVTLACHMRTHNNEKPFSCPHCKKAFSSRATLSVHKRIHSSFKPYICSYCGYSCRQSGDLAMHVRTHTGDKPYKCTFPNCDRKFTTSSQRKEHYRRHTNERNHKCKECGKAFLESKTLKVHMLIHTGEKPHNCDVCGRNFRRTHHLANHMKSHANFTYNIIS